MGVFSGGRLCGCPMTLSISGLTLAFLWNLWVPQVHGNNIVDIVFSWDISL